MVCFLIHFWQPFLQNYDLDVYEPKVDYLHFNGFFIGNNHLITDSEIDKLETLIDVFLKDKIKWIYESPDGDTVYRRPRGSNGPRELVTGGING